MSDLDIEIRELENELTERRQLMSTSQRAKFDSVTNGESIVVGNFRRDHIGICAYRTALKNMIEKAKRIV